MSDHRQNKVHNSHEMATENFAFFISYFCLKRHHFMLVVQYTIAALILCKLPTLNSEKHVLKSLARK